MKLSFYPKLAWSGIRKNGRLYLPYLFTCVGVIALYYIISALAGNESLDRVQGGALTRELLNMGRWVIAAFSAIFLFYTNSFLIRRRTKEFGLYAVLGMSKWNMGGILLAEAVIVALIAQLLGLAGGVVLYKLAELVLINVMHGEATFEQSISWGTVWTVLQLYSGIFMLIFVHNLFRIHTANAVALLRSESVGEKPPKANWLLGLAGAVLLAGAYFIALRITSPLEVLTWFFVAVFMVIGGTYLLFIAGSVTLCRILQRNRRFYYQKNHFISVSSLVYRMKRNGAGLASICILSTMVLVILSSTTCLYFGAENVVDQRYPYDIATRVTFGDDVDRREYTAFLRGEVGQVLADRHISIEAAQEYQSVSAIVLLKDGQVSISSAAEVDFSMDAAAHLCNFIFVSLEDYEQLTGENIPLGDREVLVANYRAAQDIHIPYIAYPSGERWDVVRETDLFLKDGMAMADILPTFYIVANDTDAIVAPIMQLWGQSELWYRWNYSVDVDAGPEEEKAAADAIYDRFRTLELVHGMDDALDSYSCEDRTENWEDYFSLFGGLLYLGMILSTVFLLAAVLIIYYKQVVEGYEDQSRFEIMQRVGMTRRDIRKSINSQMLMVFFLPLVMAVLHLSFAFPMIYKLLMLFNLNNIQLLLGVTGASVLLFALFYVLVYGWTSNAYYRIVSGARED